MASLCNDIDKGCFHQCIYIFRQYIFKKQQYFRLKIWNGQKGNQGKKEYGGWQDGNDQIKCDSRCSGNQCSFLKSFQEEENNIIYGDFFKSRKGDFLDQGKKAVYRCIKKPEVLLIVLVRHTGRIERSGY